MRIFIILILLVSCQNNQTKKYFDKSMSNSQEDSFEQKVELDSINSYLHQIIKVDSIGSVYLVYTKKCNIYYKILSDKADNKNNCSKVIIGQYYDLKVESAFPKMGKYSHEKFYYGILYNGQEIEIEKDSINDLHFSEDLKGLCFINND